MIPAELDTGPSPPGPEMRRPGANLANARCRFSEPTIDIYASGSVMSSFLPLDMSSKAPRKGKTSRRHIACQKGDMSREGETCSR